MGVGAGQLPKGRQAGQRSLSVSAGRLPRSPLCASSSRCGSVSTSIEQPNAGNSSARCREFWRESLSWRGFLRRRPLIQNRLKDFFGSLPKQRRDLVRNNPRNAVLLGATMGQPSIIYCKFPFIIIYLRLLFGSRRPNTFLHDR